MSAILQICLPQSFAFISHDGRNAVAQDPSADERLSRQELTELFYDHLCCGLGPAE